MKTPGKKILMAMSGGIDSSVAANILKNQGHNVIGIFLKFWHENNPAYPAAENKCCSEQSFLDAKSVCQKIGIPLYSLNYEKNFKQEIVDYFLKSYEAGETPNPCIICNKKIKLGLLIKYARELGFDLVATGHYAKTSLAINKKQKTEHAHQTIKLLTTKDKKKDQSYFLYALNQNELPHLMFPLANYIKEEVRQLAKKWQLPVIEKKESQEVCFISDATKNFLKRNLKLKTGFIKTTDGKIIGEHGGLPLYTIGQRQGININNGPYYVIKKDLAKNELIVTDDKNDAKLLNKTAVIKNVNWISGIKPLLPLKCFGRHRYRAKLERVVVTKQNTGEYLVTFKNPVRALTPGQSIVFYQPLRKFFNKDYEILGGGVMC
ncbi:tRNA 2-thiouridine(34) synthase MnmA [Candidatus Kuenenbacteria bacterium CG10_big_fil_rev_8_21_14_0_10_36_11]|uniref:tRNA-specific 2-thiouridylase MnmA n=1 Tax=Candidatus Kuenenbacteria bacterium CG10_big_fil_rev_8_21_14_0_10_36_11 TaxID=1974618 RepID=A0A2M6WAT9_9BACT|nr:MAG: tRNA 2-thiouridine(34) synthase MnmA [Candidatus Kuenenbacteria bacterium CG10_big_fil_rev_8_21_14_0_10_36_11]